MAEYNYCMSYCGVENKEKYLRYPYSSWCATCERNIPRRRSRSETLEPCRRKCKEMKTHTPKKYNKSTEYENMDLECDIKGWHETKYDSFRVRSNLVELPTSYISNNCQDVSVAFSNNDMECFENVKPSEPQLKFVDFNNQLPNLEAMQEHPKFGSKSHYQFSRLNGFVNKSRSPIKDQELQNYSFRDNQDYQNANCKVSDEPKYLCKDYCPLVDFKSNDSVEKRPLCYDTGTYFDRQYDSVNLHERYNKEIDFLRERLRALKNSALSNTREEKSTHNPKIEVFKCETILRNNSEENTSNSLKEKPVISLMKRSKSKVSLKTKRVGSARAKKIMPKVQSLASTTDCGDSDISDSESDAVDDDSLECEPDSLTDLSTDESKDVSDTNSSLRIHSSGSGDSLVWPMRTSLFPNIPPYIKFNSHDAEVPFKIPMGKRVFKWKLSTITPIIVRKTLTNSGFVLVRKSNQWLGTWGKHMKSPMFKTLKDMQKLNHFPGTFQLGRKDRLWRNFQRMINKYGLKEFGFLPHTYVLPQELRLLKQNWEFRNGTGNEMWIIKPPASARGVGIKVINKWSQLPKKTSLVVQKYISNPYLINGSKFDLRLYVLVTSFNPLRIYLYPDGLARFASAKYSDDAKDLKDRYMHLTNYSINKLSSQYAANEDANACQGHKWTLSKLMEYLQKDGVDTKLLWKNLQALVIKTIITAEPLITPLCEENMNSLYNCYELFGVDVLLDQNLKPWLLEVNISPSLHSASPLDAHVKGPMVHTLFDMAQFHFPQRLSQHVKQSPKGFDSKMYATTLTKREISKHRSFEQFERREDYLTDILSDLTGDDVRQLTRAEDESVVKGRFEKIFPTASTYKYLQYMEPRYYNRLFDAWEAKYSWRREEGIAELQQLCAQKLHLKVAPQSSLSKNLSKTIAAGLETKLVPSTTGQSRPLEDIMQETSITNKVSTNS